MTIEIQYEGRAAERRRAKRGKTDIDCMVRERSRSATTASVNGLSIYGCRVENSAPLIAGNPIWVRLPGLESIAGRVVWVDSCCSGIEFETRLHAAVAERFEQMDSDPPYATRSVQGEIAIKVDKLEADPILTRREQIMNGIVDTDASPLKKQKLPKGTAVANMIRRHETRQANHRKEERFKEFLEGSPMIVRLGVQSGMIENVSSSGIRVRTDIEAEIGDSLEVEFIGFPLIEGKVVWMGSGEAGLSLPDEAIQLC